MTHGAVKTLIVKKPTKPPIQNMKGAFSVKSHDAVLRCVCGYHCLMV